MRRGVAGDQLIAKGFGEASPVASNATAARRLSNRRVAGTCSRIRATFR